MDDDRSLSFLAQVNLLSFFYYVDEQPWGLEAADWLVWPAGTGVPSTRWFGRAPAWGDRSAGDWY